MAEIIAGSRIADKLCSEVACEVRLFEARVGSSPTLAVVLVGEDPASGIYVRRKVKKCREVGIRSLEYRMPASTSEAELLALVAKLNGDSQVHGILVQLPLPEQINAVRVLNAISPDKDVDGFHPVNVGRLSTGSEGLVPCTPLGCMLLLEAVVGDQFRGKNAVVIGKSNIVGKPVALLLLERECTVMVTHIATLDLPAIVKQADIVVAAAGAPRLVRGEWVKPGAIVIDVGITRLEDENGVVQIVGDCCADEMGHARAVSPVPGGVGPMTIACLLSNTMKAARRLHHV